MRRFWAIFRTAFLEALSEPVAAVLFLAAPLVVHLAPAVHCHQFGEVGRLARECGFSALLVFGLTMAVAAAIGMVGREFESGTAAAALARPVARPLFFCGKICGALAALGLFWAAASAATLVAVRSAELGAEAMARGGLSRTWGPGLAAGVAASLGAAVAAALLNRARNARFCVWACVLSAGLHAAGAGAAHWLGGGGLAWRMVLPMGALAAGCGGFVAMAGALRAALKPAAAAAAVCAAVALSFAAPLRAVMPDVNMFWTADALADGGEVEAGELWRAFAAAALATGFWLTAGSALAERKDA